MEYWGDGVMGEWGLGKKVKVSFFPQQHLVEKIIDIQLKKRQLWIKIKG